ncbi:MAG TPA: SPOR domain-containing protein [Hydrogenophaga sp.]|uniref:SPOR domain-containing protein n=1 Tax=Hydrogenophaga sp. TaxID=1904254 RepID=UPI002B51F7AA|nr:SPOR domain-containing protein [Hydrogenophaga sp.]HMN92046.1 SPOR domain-containing protein [Hydrogenophaga sp.]HMP08847.1 SPOR domain-containing protein [Hydrogenophaga sp.]
MLRWTIVALALANLLYYGWTQGLLGDTQGKQREPERLQAQLRPETVRLVTPPSSPPPSSNGSPSAPAPTPGSVTEPDTRCWVASGFSTAEAETLRNALTTTGLAASAWRIEEVRVPGRWIVYMGRFNPEQVARKKVELRELKVDFREVNIAAGPGLALGTFSTEEAAEQGLRDLARKGVRTARVEAERPETVSHVLRLPAVTDAQRAEVAGLGAALAGKPLQPCE